MKHVTLYSTRSCPWCVQAENLLARLGVPVDKIRVDEQPEQLTVMLQRSQRRTVPQLFVGDTHIGGFSDLVDAEQDGTLQRLLAD